MKRLLVVFFLCSSHQAFAVLPEMSMWRIGAQVNLVGNQEINQSAMEWGPAFGLEVGLEFEPWSIGIAWRHMESEGESGTYSVDTNQERFMLNGRRSWHGDQDWLAWVQAGVGFQWFNIDMRMGSTTRSETSDKELVTGLSLGFGWPLEASWRTEIAGQVHKTQTRSALEASALVSLVRLF